MANILNIETATTNCSVSLGEKGALISVKENNTATYSHSEQLHVFIEQLIEAAAIDFSDLDAVAISGGPGSYTGLRIGVAAAKGLCYSLGIPLIAISTLESMAYQLKVPKGFIIPVLDARRMEVYSSVFDHNYKKLRKVAAEIIDKNSFMEYAEKEKVYLIGSGAAKCEELLVHPNFNFEYSIVPSSKEMIQLSYQKFTNSEFEDVAYFEPYYLKDFIATVKKQ